MAIQEFDEMCGQLVKDSVARKEIEEIKAKMLKYKPVTELPTENIEENTLYLLPTGQTGSNKYTAHMYVNGEWEDFETLVEIDMSGYAKMLTAGTGKNYDYVVCLFNGLGEQVSRELATTSLLMDKAYTIPAYWNNDVLNSNQIPKCVIPVGTPIYHGHAANKKYVDDTCVKKPAPMSGTDRVLGVASSTNETLAWNANPVYIYDVDDYGRVIPMYKKVGKEILNPENAPEQTIYIATPQLNYEAVNKKYVDDQVGAIDTVLDSILAIQNSLIVEEDV